MKDTNEPGVWNPTWHRPVRTILHGDKEVALGNRPNGQRLLFQLKNLQNQGFPGNSIRRTLHDGTEIRVHSNIAGMDVIEVNGRRGKPEPVFKPDEFPIPIILAFYPPTAEGDKDVDAVGGYTAENFIYRFMHWLENTPENTIKDKTFHDGRFSECERVSTPDLIRHRLYQPSDRTTVLVSQQYGNYITDAIWVTETHINSPIKLIGYIDRLLGYSTADFYFTKIDYAGINGGGAHYYDTVQQNLQYAYCYRGSYSFDGEKASDSWSAVWEYQSRYCYQYSYYFNDLLNESKNGNPYPYSFNDYDQDRLYDLDTPFPDRSRTDQFRFSTDEDDFILGSWDNVNGIDTSACVDGWGLGTGVFEYNKGPVYMCSYFFYYPSCDPTITDMYIEYCFVYQRKLHRLRFQCSGDYWDDVYEPWHYFDTATYISPSGKESVFNSFPKELSGLVGNGRFRVGKCTIDASTVERMANNG